MVCAAATEVFETPPTLSWSSCEYATVNGAVLVAAAVTDAPDDATPMMYCAPAEASVRSVKAATPCTAAFESVPPSTAPVTGLVARVRVTTSEVSITAPVELRKVTSTSNAVAGSAAGAMSMDMLPATGATAPASSAVTVPPSATTRSVLAPMKSFDDVEELLLQAWFASRTTAPSANNRLYLFTIVSIGRGP